MIATVGDGDLRILAQEAAATGKVVLVTTGITGTSATLSAAVAELMINSSYVSAETDGPRSNIFETKYQRQREWWNTPKKERRRKRK